jgi:hypothetical protein
MDRARDKAILNQYNDFWSPDTAAQPQSRANAMLAPSSHSLLAFRQRIRSP